MGARGEKNVDIMQMAGHLNLHPGIAGSVAYVLGPFGPGGESGEAALVFLANGYGIFINKGSVDGWDPDTAVVSVVRESQDTERGWAFDWSVRVTGSQGGCVPDLTVDDLVAVLQSLSLLPRAA